MKLAIEPELFVNLHTALIDQLKLLRVNRVIEEQLRSFYKRVAILSLNIEADLKENK